MANENHKPPQDFFTLEEVALRFGWTTDAVMRVAMDGKLKVSYRYSRTHKKTQYISIGVPSLEALERTKTLWLEDSTGKETHVKREDLLVSRAEVERFEKAHAPQPAPDETEPQIIEESVKPAPAQDAWIARARELYTELKQEQPRLNQNQLAKKIEPILANEGYLGKGKKTLTAENITRRALQNIGIA